MKILLTNGTSLGVPAQPGGSGSPLLTMERAVAGVVTAGTNEEQFMRDSGALPQKLDWPSR